MDILVTVSSTDTRTWGMVEVWYMCVSTVVIVPSADTRTWGMVHM